MYKRFIKRLFDIIISLSAIVVLALPMLVIALVIKIDDPGPVFYRQVRVGRNGKEFRIFKFRTMIVDADKKGLQITVGRDNRITRMGRFLRRTKLDARELESLYPYPLLAAIPDLADKRTRPD